MLTILRIKAYTKTGYLLNYGATSNNMKLVHWPLMGGMLRLIQRGGAC